MGLVACGDLIGADFDRAPAGSSGVDAGSQSANDGGAGSWHVDELPGSSVSAVAAADATHVYAASRVGTGTQLYRRDGSQWLPVGKPLVQRYVTDLVALPTGEAFGATLALDTLEVPGPLLHQTNETVALRPVNGASLDALPTDYDSRLDVGRARDDRRAPSGYRREQRLHPVPRRIGAKTVSTGTDELLSAVWASPARRQA